MRLITREKIRSAIDRFVFPELSTVCRDLPVTTRAQIESNSEESVDYVCYNVYRYRGISYEREIFRSPIVW